MVVPNHGSSVLSTRRTKLCFHGNRFFRTGLLFNRALQATPFMMSSLPDTICNKNPDWSSISKQNVVIMSLNSIAFD